MKKIILLLVANLLFLSITPYFPNAQGINEVVDDQQIRGEQLEEIVTEEDSVIQKELGSEQTNDSLETEDQFSSDSNQTVEENNESSNSNEVPPLDELSKNEDSDNSTKTESQPGGNNLLEEKEDQNQSEVQKDEDEGLETKTEMQSQFQILNIQNKKLATNIKNEKSISKLGFIKTERAVIYPNIGSNIASFRAEKEYTNKIYYIKKQAEFNNQLYYLISERASSTQGLLGWINALDVTEREHTSVDKKDKKFHIKGINSAYLHAWGKEKDIAFQSLSRYRHQIFQVHLTEKVGNEIWYRGTLAGKTVWIHSNDVATLSEGKISKLGKIKTTSAKIYTQIGVPSTAITAGTAYTNKVFYIKKQAAVGNDIYYLLSNSPSSVNGVVGWIRVEDLISHDHLSVDKNNKKFKISGTGSAYLKAWGGDKDIVYKDLSKYKNQVVQVHLTEKVGGNIWYRGNLDGKTIWLHSSQVNTGVVTESTTSKLGKIKASTAKIYPNLNNILLSSNAGTANLNKVFYIKKQAKLGSDTYYLLSNQPSSVNGLVGWVRAQDLNVQDHTSVDKKEKTFYLTANGNAYTKAWGGDQDVVYNLSRYRHRQFQVHLTEKVGNELWYRGTLDGKTVWIQANQSATLVESTTSHLGKIKTSSAKIYPKIGIPSTAITAGTTHTNKVFYIKKQAKVGNDVYYLLSNNPSSTNGVVGWIRVEDLEVHTHSSVDKRNKIFYISGTGSAYTKAWGAEKDIVIRDLSQYKNEVFNVHLTEKVGTAIWYRGTLNGKTVWILASHLAEQGIQYTQYNITFNNIVTKQMTTNPPPQTDLYRNQPGYVSKADVTITRGGAITGDGVNLRAQANTTSKIVANVRSGTVIKILGTVTGQSVSGSTQWYKIEYNKQVMYVHSSLASANVTTATTNKKTNVYSSANNNGHIYITLAANTKLTLVSEGSAYHTINIGTWRNAMKSDVNFYMNPNNNDIYQHLILSKTAGLSAKDLSLYLSDKGILSGKGQAFIDSGKQYNVNEIYLMFHAMLETGNGTSTLAKGVYVDKNGNLITDSKGNPILSTNQLPAGATKVYNMFGIGAIDSNPTVGGAKHAFQKGWTTPEKAILGGAQWISSNYINHSSYKQDTLYKMKWNPAVPAAHQYATDIGWAVKQAARFKEIYDKHSNASSYFDIPRYK